MNRPEATELDRYFWSLQDRYRQYVTQQLKISMEHAGYKGLTFIHTLYTMSILYRSNASVPQLVKLIDSFELHYMFDRRDAASKAVKAALPIDFAGIGQLTAEMVADELENISGEMLGYWLDALNSLEQETAGKEQRAVKFLLRYYTLKTLVNKLEPEFAEEQMNVEAASCKAIDEYERQNEAAERIGKRVFPELFVPGFESSVVERQEQKPASQQPEQQPAKEPERMEWLGTQVQLAELFIELERKGWIRKKLPKAIMASFTNSNTIRKMFTADKDMGEETYSAVFRKNYSPKFKRIEKNKKITP